MLTPARTTAVLALACLILNSSAQSPAPSRLRPAPTTEPAATPATQLPVTRVSLYKNGVGFFEHAGHVTGNQSVTIDFTTAQLNDVLQSLTAIDLNGGRIAGAGYNSTTPLKQQLKALPLALGEDPSDIDFYQAIRGSRIQVTAPGTSITGRLLSIDLRDKSPAPDDSSTPRPKDSRRFLTVVAESGETRTIELTSATSVRLLDTALHTDVTRYLELLASNRSQGLRHLTLRDNGTGTRDLRVSYISEVPVWKSTYRILFTDAAKSTTTQTATLQGWAVVDNTVGTDWTNVQLSLVAGAPQSFIQPLSTPYYSRRPEIPLPAEAQLSPQTHESGDEDDKSVAQSKEYDRLDKFSRLASPAPIAPSAVAKGRGMGVAGGIMDGTGSVSETVTVSSEAASINYEDAATNSLIPQTTTSAFDDYFEYKISQPITIRKNESALVPILQTKIDAQRVSLWSPSHPVALRALWIKNTSDLTLDRGSFSIVENGNFGGEGLLDPIHPAERRLLSYAADQSVRVSTDNAKGSSHVDHISINKGVLTQTSLDLNELEYVVHNAAPEARTVVIEHAARPGWTLDSANPTSKDTKPTESTPAVHRFTVEVPASQTIRLHVGERHPNAQYIRLTDRTDDQLALMLRNANASPALLQQLEPVFAARRALTALNIQMQTLQTSQNEIVQDQTRLRANLSALKGSAEERTLAKRYTDELNQQEDKLADIRKQLDTLKQQRNTAQLDLSNKIEVLHLDENLS